MQGGGQFHRRVELDQVAGAADEAQARPGDGLRQAAGPVDRDPGVVLAPDHLHRDADLAVARLDLVGEPLVGRGDLAVEGRLALRAQPGSDQHVLLRGGQPGVGGAADVGADGGLVDVRREPGEHLVVLGDEPEEVRAPRRQRDHVHQRQRGEVRPVQQVRAQRHRPAVVVRDHVGSLQTRVGEQGGEDLSLEVEADRVPGVHRGLPVSGHVPQVDGVVGRQRLGEGPPQRRRPRSAVAEHHRRAGPEPVPAHRPSVAVEFPVQ